MIQETINNIIVLFSVEINIAGDIYRIQFDLSEQGRQTDG
jgi:hypothetical protein